MESANAKRRSAPDCLRTPDACRVWTEGGDAVMAREGDGYTWNDVRLETRAAGDRLNCRLTGKRTAILMVALRWRGAWPDGCRFLGDAVERGYGRFEWRGLSARRLMPWYFAANTGRITWAAGVMTAPDAFCFFRADDGGVTLYLDVRCGGMGVILNGKTIAPASVKSAEYADVSAFCALRAFCRLLCERPLLPPHPAFGSNNWYYAYGRACREDILSQAEETLQWSAGNGEKPYVVIDDCWQAFADVKSAAGRPYTRGNARFPDMPGLARKLREMGCRPGIWMRPLENLDRFYQGARVPGRAYPVLDCTVSENLAVIGEDIKRLADWGYELIKYDFVVRDLLGLYVRDPDEFMKIDGWAFADRAKTSAMCVKALCGTIRENAGDAVLIGCNVPGHLAAGSIHIHRGGDDTNAFSWDRTVQMGVNTLAFRLCQDGALFAMDADCVGIVKGGIPWALNRQFLDLLAHSGTPLFVSATPGLCSMDMTNGIRAAFKTWGAGAAGMEPLDWLENALPRRYTVDGGTAEYSWFREAGISDPRRL